MSRYKTWIVVGCTTGSLTVALFIGLATHVFLNTPEPDPRFVVLSMLDLLMGMASTCLIIGGKMCQWMAETRDEFGNQRWWKGYSAAAEDLVGDENVVPFPAPAERTGRHG